MIGATLGNQLFAAGGRWTGERATLRPAQRARNEVAARAWVAEQVRRFPGDAVTVEEADPTDPENPFPGA